MFCETCGKKLIRGYSFCVDCGTPVPPGTFDREEEEAPVTELKPGMGIDDAMPGIAPKRTSDEGANLSSGSRVPLFNTENTGLGGLGLDDPNQAFVNLFGNPSAAPVVNNSGFNSGSSNIDMPSIEAPAKSSQAKQKNAEKGETVLLNDFSMASAAGDETLEVTDKPVTVLGGTSMEMGAGADIDLSPYKFLDNKIDMNEEPAAVQPEPVAVQPEPAAVQPEPVAVQPEPVAVQPEPVAVQPEPVAVQPEPVAVQPEPVAVEPEPVAVQPEPVAVEPEPAAVQPEPVAVQPEPAAVQPEPAAVQPEPAAVQPEPAAVQPEPAAVQPEPAAVQPEPAAVQPEPAAVQPKPAEPKAPANDNIDDFIPEEMQVIEETVPFIEETAIPGMAAVAVAQETKTEAKPEPVLVPPVQPVQSVQPVQPGSEAKSAEPPKPVDAAPVKSTEQLNAPQKPAYDLVLGRLVRCKVCGQEMYEKEEVCGNCGARRGAQISPTPPKQPWKLFGILPLSAVIGMASVVVVMTALIIFLAVKNGGQKVPVQGEISGSDVSSFSTSSASSATGSSSSAVSSSSGEPEQSSESSSSEPENSTPASTSSETPVSSSTTAVSQPKPASTPRSTPKSTPKSTPESTPKSTPQSSSIKPQSSSSTSVVEPPSDKMTLRASIHETDRRKLAETAATIEGEIGKIHVYSQLMTKSSDSESKVPIRLTSALMSSIEDGNETVDSAMSKVSSVNSDLVPCRKAVETLRAKYDEYYNYVKENSTLDAATCNSYFNAFEQQLRTVRLNQYTSSYNSNDKRLASESMNSIAVDDINDTYSTFYNLRDTFSKTSLNYADSAYNALSSSSEIFCDAVVNTYKVKAYGILMGDDAGVKGNFDKLYQRIDTYINLDKYVGDYDGYYKAAY